MQVIPKMHRIVIRIAAMVHVNYDIGLESFVVIYEI